MAKIFAKLNLGDIVAASGSRVFRKLSTEEPAWKRDDLTGTVWYIPSGWTCKASELSASIRGTVTLDGNTNSRVFTVFVLGQRYTEIPTSASNNIWINNSNAEGISGRSYWDNTRGFTLTIDGGSDHKHPDLISWLTKYGTLLSYPIPDDDGELPVWNGSDLTDTTWDIPAGWEAEAGYGYYEFNGSINGLAFIHSNSLCIGYRGNKSFNTIDLTNDVVNSICARVNNDSGYKNFDNTSSLQIIFTGGTDVTNADLIAWLKQNGELTSHTMPIISFTIDGTSYQAEECMTWEEWITSDYNTNSYTENLLDGTQTVFIESSGVPKGYGVAYNDNFVSVEDTIVVDGAYTKKLGTHM